MNPHLTPRTTAVPTRRSPNLAGDAALALHLRQRLAGGQAVDGKLGAPRAAVVLAGRERNAGGAVSFEVDRHRIIGTQVILLQFGVVWTSCALIRALICSAT